MKRTGLLKSRSKSNRLGSSKPTSSGLKPIHTLNSLTVSTKGKESTVLQNVPEHTEIELQNSSILKPKEIFRNEDWNRLQEAIKTLFEGNNPLSKSGELYKLHENVKNILRSKTGTFLTEYYKQESLSKGMDILAERLKNVRGFRLLQRMEDIWYNFFQEILPTLEAILYLVKPKGRLTIRTTTLAAFRDDVVLSVDFKGILLHALESKKSIPEGIKHMLLVLQGAKDSYPPNKNRLLLESIVALLVSPYLGYLGLYEGNSIPSVKSNVPNLNRRRSSDIGGPRRVSRPFSVQPRHLDTLNQIFLNAIRNKQEMH